ncbi:MAG: diguanylate cyclase [Acidimicrobiia bacterium]|nr:diguanylate cyclase [Acidimicrobiia bacterium]
MERDEPVVRLVRSEGGIITAVSDEIAELLGHQPADLVGTPSTEWIHPDDQAGAVQAWMTMLAAPGAVGEWVGRYRTSTGGWSWISTENVNHLDDPARPRVETTMRAASVETVSVEEELRRREELISRLAEALPVGVFQVDEHLQLLLTNDRLAQILGGATVSTTEELTSFVAEEHHLVVGDAIFAVLRGEPVDDIEVRLVASELTDRPPDAQFCRFSLRALTDATGAVNGAIGCVQDVTDSVVLRHTLEMRAATDDLTGCLNRPAIEALLTQLLGGAGGGSGVAVAFVDLDRFKAVNDQHGHGSGDQVLVKAGERLRAAVRACDHIGRVGGDEFLVVCPDVGSEAMAAEIGERLASTVNGPVATQRGPVDLRASVGIAWACDAGCSPDHLIRCADEAMYAAKADARGPVLRIANG